MRRVTPLILLCIGLMVMPVLHSQENTPEPTLTPFEAITPPHTETFTPSPFPSETPTVLPSDTQTLASTASETATETSTATLDFSTMTATLGSSLTPSATATASETASASSLELIFSDDFESINPLWNFTAVGWGYSGGEGAKYLSVYNSDASAILNLPDSANVVVEAKFLVDNGTAYLSSHQSIAGDYTVTLDASGTVKLYRSGAVVGLGTVLPSTGQWRTLQLSAINGDVRVSVDTLEAIVFVDSSPLPAGKIAIHGYFTPLADNATPYPPQNTLGVDDVRVWQSGAVSAVTATPTASATLTETPTVSPTPTDMPIIQAEVTWADVLREDFESGWAEPDGFRNLGFYAPFGTNQTVHAPLNGRPTLLVTPASLDMALQTDVLFSTGTLELITRLNGLQQDTARFGADGTVSLYRNDQLLTSTLVAPFVNQWTTIRFEVFANTLRVLINGVVVMSAQDESLSTAGIAGFNGAGDVVFDNILVQAPPSFEVQAFQASLATVQSAFNSAMNPDDRVFFTKNKDLYMYDGYITTPIITAEQNNIAQHSTTDALGEPLVVDYLVKGVGKFEWSPDKHWLAFECTLALSDTPDEIGFQDLCMAEFDSLGYLSNIKVWVKTDTEYEKWGSWHYTDTTNYSFVYSRVGFPTTVYTDNLTAPFVESFELTLPQNHVLDTVVYARDAYYLYYSDSSGIYSNQPNFTTISYNDLVPPNEQGGIYDAIQGLELWYASSEAVLYSFFTTELVDGTFNSEFYRLHLKNTGQTPTTLSSFYTGLGDGYIAGVSSDNRLIYRHTPYNFETAYTIVNIAENPISTTQSLDLAPEQPLQHIALDRFPKWPAVVKIVPTFPGLTQETSDMKAVADEIGLIVHDGPTWNATHLHLIADMPTSPEYRLSWGITVKIDRRVEWPNGEIWYRLFDSVDGTGNDGWINARSRFNVDAEGNPLPSSFSYIEGMTADFDPTAGHVDDLLPTETITFTYDRQKAAEYGVAQGIQNSAFAIQQPQSFSQISYRTGQNTPFANIVYDITFGLPGTTASGVFISEVLWMGGMPMIQIDPNECSGGALVNEGWRYCNTQTTFTWRVHEGVAEFFTNGAVPSENQLLSVDSDGDGNLNPDTDGNNVLDRLNVVGERLPESSANSDFKSPTILANEIRILNEGNGFINLDYGATIGEPDFNGLSEFLQNRISNIQKGDYVWIRPNSGDDHGFIVVGWAEATNCQIALDNPPISYFATYNQAIDNNLIAPLPYIVDFTRLQRVSPRPFFCSFYSDSESKYTEDNPQDNKFDFHNWFFYTMPNSVTVTWQQLYSVPSWSWTSNDGNFPHGE